MITENKTLAELEIILVRAGASELDAQGRITGSLDVPLSPESNAHIQETAEELADRKINAVYSAKCLAAQQTAAQLVNGRRLKVRVVEDLVNLDHGLWHGKSIMELKETQPRLFRQWQENPEFVCPPEGESFPEARTRVADFLKKVRKRHRSGTIVVVVPDPLLSVFLGRTCHVPLTDVWDCVAKSGEWQKLALETTNVTSVSR